MTFITTWFTSLRIGRLPRRRHCLPLWIPEQRSLMRGIWRRFARRCRRIRSRLLDEHKTENGYGCGDVEASGRPRKAIPTQAREPKRRKSRQAVGYEGDYGGHSQAGAKDYAGQDIAQVMHAED